MSGTDPDGAVATATYDTVVITFSEKVWGRVDLQDLPADPPLLFGGQQSHDRAQRVVL